MLGREHLQPNSVSKVYPLPNLSGGSLYILFLHCSDPLLIHSRVRSYFSLQHLLYPVSLEHSHQPAQVIGMWVAEHHQVKTSVPERQLLA